ncbi:Signal peptidase I [Actinomadura rubteroloni]|uniref:Signal peptidase I n=1 Tax=Actinomadura rubteroloni TaxID=1926885 RepID=A0A2P4UQ19_9ACTN|nr:signal peptidase I [Actinomadura rubteroloni]POM27146.1 Signal peptidase I [Actinomadura rubteroloni]
MQSDAEDRDTERAPEAGENAAEREQGNGRSSWKEIPLLIVVAVLLAFVVKLFAVQAFYIPSGSMENTLHVGDRVLVNKIVYRTRAVRRGDVIVFRGPSSWTPEAKVAAPSNPFQRALRWLGGAAGVAPTETDFIKRVIGVGGDRVRCCDAQGRVTVNGTALDESSYLYEDPVTHVRNKPSEEAFDITVPSGRLWVMGDHRQNSADSRYHRTDGNGGTVPVKNVIGRAFFKVWPVGSAGPIGVPATFGRVASGRGAPPGGPAEPAAPDPVAADVPPLAGGPGRGGYFRAAV